jgi:hypothetical protein
MQRHGFPPPLLPLGRSEAERLKAHALNLPLQHCPNKVVANAYKSVRLLHNDYHRCEHTKDERDDAHQRCHWSTSSARKRRVGDMVSPRALAVLRLMTSSNVMGCSTGRSAGLAPLRILSTYVAPRRYASVLLRL